MKVTESQLESGKRKWTGGLCDFCGVREARHSINGSLWFICEQCMEYEFGDCKPPLYCVYKSCECEEE